MDLTGNERQELGAAAKAVLNDPNSTTEQKLEAVINILRASLVI